MQAPHWLRQGLKDAQAAQEELREGKEASVSTQRVLRVSGWKQELRGWLFIACVLALTLTALATALEWRALGQELREGLRQMTSSVEGGR